MVMLCCVSLQVMAQSELTVADSTATSSYVPAYGLYADTQNARSQCLYPANLLTGMNGGTISQMTFYLSSPASEAWTGTFQVRIGETDETSLSNGWIEDDLTVVYTGAMDATGTTLTVVFDDGYTYNGGNLVFDWLVTTAGNYKSASFYCASLTGASRYRSSGTAAGSVVAYLPKCTFEYTPSSGPIIVCDSPETADITDITANSATLTVSGGSQTYNIEIKGGAYDDWTYLLKNTTNTSIPLTGLTPYTSYQIRVKSVCDGGATSGSKTVQFKTLIGIPYVDDLATQGEWTKKQGLLSDIMSGMAFGTGSGTWNFGARNGVLGGNHAYMNLYGTSCKNWIISPMIPLPEGGNYVLTYQVALTDFNNEDPIEYPTSQQDDKLVVLVSADSCHTWSILQQWDNQGSPYVYNAIPTTGEEVEIDLSAYAGQEIQIAFYGESTVSGGDNDIHVGHVLIDYAPSCMTPDGLVAANATKNSLQLDWNAKSGETAWILQYKKPSAEEYTSINIAQKPYNLQGLEEFTEYQVRVAGKCSDAEDGTSKFCKPVTFKTASGVPFVQSFDTANLVSEWVRYEALLSDVLNEGATLESTSKGWNVADANGIFPSADYHLVLNLKDSTSRYWIVGPTIEMEDNQQLTFDLAFTKADGNKQAVETGKQNSQKFYVFITTDNGATWTDIAKWTNSGDGFSLDGINTEGQTAKIDLTAYATNSIKLAFYGESTISTDASNNLHIANVKVAEIPACSKPTSLNITGVKGTTATAVWESDEDGLWQYGYVVKPTGDFVPADSLFIGTTDETTYDMTGLTETTHYMFFVRHICGNDTSEALVKEFATIQTPTDLPYEQDFETVNGWKLINGELENHWVWGESARANNTPSGSKALYISNDNLGTYAYTRGGTGKAAMVYAVKTFYFDQAGMYSFQYDWKCWGYSSYDYLRVALIPADVELEAGTDVLSGFSSTALPEGWAALDGGSRLNQDSAWNHQLTELTIDKAGYYQMVFAWRNYTYTSGKNPPAAVDNIKIARITCTKPSHLTYADLTATGVTFNWDAVDGASFDYALVTADEDSAFLAAPVFIEVPGGANTIQFDTLAAQTTYKFYLRKACGGEDGNSDVISLDFTTKCLPYPLAANEGVYTEGFEDYEGTTYAAVGVAPDCWDVAINGGATVLPHVIGSGSYYYKHDGTKALTFHGKGNCYAALPVFVEDLSTLQIKFWMQTESATNGSLTLGYITAADNGDFSTFQAITSFANNNGSMVQREAVLSDISNEAYRLAFRWYYSGQYSCCIDDITVEEIPSCMKPTDLAVIDSLTTTTSATITWTPGLNETNWFVQYKKTADSVWTLVPDSVLSDTLVLAGLEAANTYDVRVAAWCNTADSTAISEYTAPITIATLCEPYSIATKGDFIEGFEDYEGTTYAAAGVVPVCWDVAIANGATVYPHILDKTKSTSYAYVHEGTNALTFHGKGDCLAALPELADSLKFLQIGFWMQTESATNGTLYLGYIDTAAYYHDLVAYERSNGAMSYRETKLDTIPDEAYRLVFRWNYSGQYSCCIDDIKISYIPDCQKPENVEAVDSLATASSVLLKWDAQGSETAWVVQYKEATDSIWTTIAADNDSAFVIDGLKAATYYDVQVAALCGATDTSEYSIPITIHTGCALVSEFPFSENFDIMEGKTTGKNLPLCWSQINTGTNTSYNSYPMVYKGATYANSGLNSLKFYAYYSSTAGAVTDQYAVLPEMEGISALRMRFNARKYSASYNATFTVGVMTDPADASTYVALDTITPSAATYEPFRVLFNAYEGGAKYIAIKMDAPTSSYKGVHIDDIVIDSIPNCLEPDSLTAVLTKGQGSIATLKWAAGAASAWEVQYGMDPKFADAITANVNEPTLSLTGLISDSTYYARVKAICSATEESEWSNVISFTPMNAIIINDGTTTGSYVPFYGYYADMGTNSQFIIPEKEIAAIQWDSITKLTFFSSTTTATWEGAQFDVYVAETNDTVLSAMVAWTDMHKVVNSKHLELANKQMEVTLDKPFQYQGGNLLIGFKQTVTGTDVSCSWYGKSGVSGNSMYQYSTNAASKSNFNPKVKIDHVHGEMPTCFVVKNITVSDITPSSAVLNWTPGEEGQNAWQIVYSADPAFDLANIAPEDIHDVTALPYALAELATDTLYNVYVRANCSEEGNEDYSMWSELFTFHTASSCQTPDNVKADSIYTASALINWTTYGQTLFNLLYTDGTAMDTLYSVECPYLLEGLTPSTAYGIKVQAACAGESGSWSSMATFKTAYGVPFSEKFNESSIPADWNQYSGLLSDILAGTQNLSSASSWYFGANNGVFDSHARVNIYGTSRYHWLVTPNINLTDDVQLTFDLALTKFSGTAVAVDPTQQADDKFVVLASTDNGATWTILRQWDNAGSDYVYNNIATNGEEVAISLAAYNGQSVMIAFYGESTETGGDNNLHIDNVLIDRVPTCLKPTGLSISEIRAHKAKIAWTAAEGQSAWQIAYATKATEKPDTLANILDVTVNPYVLENLDPATTYYVYVRANCGVDDGVSRWTDGKSFKTTIACPAPTNLQAVLTPGNGTIATLKWTAGGDEQSWRVEYSTNANMSDSVAVVVDDTIYNLTGLTSETTYYARVLADCGELDSLSAYSTKIEFTPTSAYRLTVNDGTMTNYYVPIYGSYVDEGTRSQFIIPEADLEELEWDSIKGLTFYASQSSVDWGAAQFEIYLAEAPETTLSEEADWTAMTLVKNAGTLSIVDNKMVVTFDSAYQYQGGNLMIGFYQTVNGTYNAASWYGVRANGASMGGYGFGNNYTQRNFLPKMMIDYVPGVAPACPNPKNLQVVSVAADSAVFSWKAVEGASWEYAVALASAAEPTEFNAVPAGANAIVVNGLSELTSYVFYLRRACGEDGNSEIVSVPFETLEIAEEISYSYSEDFEAATGWKLINGTETNAWMIGSATSNGGDNALYISSDGASYAYDDEAASVTYASKLFHFVRTGTFSVSYDYMCVGEYNDADGAIDYLRVALLPSDVALTAGSQLSDLVQPLDHDSALVAQSAWTRKNAIASIPAVGMYRLVFIWINDDVDSDGAPAAIDNISIQHKDNPTDIQSGAGVENKAVKFIYNNQVYILLNGNVYNITGQKVELR
mgnify:CR=1 FL=1